MTQARRRLVVDASAMIGLLLDPADRGTRLREAVAEAELHAPALLPFEVADVVRRQRDAGRLAPSAATLAHTDAGRLPIELWPYEALAERVWALSGALTAYDASYVALAERLAVPLLTADRRLSRAPGVTCELITV